MTIYQIRDFLMWCSIINVVLMTISYLLLCLMRPWVYKINSKWFPVTEPQFNAIACSFLGLYKLQVFVFNIIPYAAICIVID